MQTDNLELKKLVYLYLMNYAKSQPDMAIMAVNTFVKVSRSLVREGMGAHCAMSPWVRCYGPEHKTRAPFQTPTPSQGLHPPAEGSRSPANRRVWALLLIPWEVA